MAEYDLLNKISNNEQLYLFIHGIIDDMCGHGGPKIGDYVPHIWSDEIEFNKACEACRDLLPNAIDIRSKHESILRLPEDTQKVIYQCMEVRRAELKNVIINEAIGEKNKVLKDFYWKLKVVLSSDKMMHVNEPLVELEMRVEKNRGADGGQGNHELLNLELDRKELNNLVKTLEEAQQALKQQYQ